MYFSNDSFTVCNKKILLWNYFVLIKGKMPQYYTWLTFREHFNELIPKFLRPRAALGPLLCWKSSLSLDIKNWSLNCFPKRRNLQRAPCSENPLSRHWVARARQTSSSYRNTTYSRDRWVNLSQAMPPVMTLLLTFSDLTSPTWQTKWLRGPAESCYMEWCVLLWHAEHFLSNEKLKPTVILV